MTKLKLVSVFFILLSASHIVADDIIVKVKLGEAELSDMSSNKYPVRFSEHRGTSFVNLRKNKWLYGLLTKKKTESKYIYSIELPEIGRLIYTNPDSQNPVILDQVEHHHPSFVWSVKAHHDLEGENPSSLLKHLERREFMYQTLIGDVTAKMEIRQITTGKNAEYVRALRFNAPRAKVIREILRYKNFL